MGAGFAFGTGFVNAAVKRQEEVKDEARELRKQSWEVYVRDTLPRVRAAQAKDDAAVNSMNTIMADQRFKGLGPNIAFYGAKFLQSGKTLDEYYEMVATNQLPEEVQAQSMEEMNKHFNFDANTNSFAWKSQAPVPGPTVPGQQGKSSIMQKLGLSGKDSKAVQQGVADASGMAGVDPNAPVASRFDSINLPGGFTSKDPEAKRLQDMGIELAARNPEKLRNFGGFVQALNSGDSKKVEAALADPRFTVTREEAQKDEFNQQFRMSAMQGYLRGDYGKDSDLMRAIITGNSEKIVAGVTKGMKSDEEKLAYAEKLKKIEVSFGGLDNPIAFKMLRKSGMLDGLNIPEANLVLMEKEADDAIARQESILDRIQREALNKNLPPGQQVDPQAAPATGAAPATAGTPAPGQPAAKAMSEEDIIKDMEEGEPLKAAPKPEEKAPEKTLGARVIEDVEASKQVSRIAEKGTPEEIRAFKDPVKLLSTVATLKDPTNRATVAKNISITPDIYSRILNDIDYGNEWEKYMNSWVDQYLPEFTSMDEARAAVHPYGLAKINGDVRVIPPKKK